MERPFDYPGSTSDMVLPCFSEMRQVTSWLVHEDDGDTVIRWAVYSVPNDWSDDDMDSVVDGRFASEHCTHAHDCCGHLYARKAQWAWHPHHVECGLRAVVISQRFIRNI